MSIVYIKFELITYKISGNTNIGGLNIFYDKSKKKYQQIIIRNDCIYIMKIKLVINIYLLFSSLLQFRKQDYMSLDQF